MGRTTFRPLDGILLLDKPAGLSSNQALQRVRHLYRAEKGGHTGALDPLATGLLPLCFGEATKIAGLLLGGRKAYEAQIRFGATTDTDDADGTVLRERPVPPLDRARIEAALRPFLGRIRQRPPIYSALKQGGEPLYAKARRGETIEVAEREVEIQDITVLALDGPLLRLAVTCGSGTYIRSLARDLGEALGCGGHITALRRTWVEPFLSPDMMTPDQLQALADAGGEAALDARLLPVEAGLAHFPALALDPDQARRLGQGQVLAIDGAAPVETLNLTDLNGRSLGLGELREDGSLRPRRLFRWASAQ
ncbi:tRNA pseudouridine(55) synthase TruB [Arenimonas terrae]|uniref:tRNA pseudouridine synthase B n=1 Tax=Arenimonas terrae TaxID=2546226 RepID=A0A5C4RTZ7_9GAMM|nr:tRNA pseudouridine(55) synthase TruB [Arenimonas terrae]TNJ34399.1 tRNA pseudouridine(55) synthase TruB [Arenimonas terrae]